MNPTVELHPSQCSQVLVPILSLAPIPKTTKEATVYSIRFLAGFKKIEPWKENA